MIRILQSVSNMDRGGIETMLMNYYRHLDRDQFQFDFLVNKEKPGFFDDEVRSLGGRIFMGPGLSPLKYPEYLRYMKTLLDREKEIKVLHAHNEAMEFYALNGAKKAGFPVRIAHAHNTHLPRGLKLPVKLVCKAMIPGAATDYFACGREAGIYYFGEKRWNESGVLIHNAIDLERFGYRSEVRTRLRREYQLEDKLVVGSVARFMVQKNHTRMLEQFACLKKIYPNSHLLLAGEGELQAAMEEKAKRLGIYDSVSFLGVQKDTSIWYQAMDVFLMPSLFEPCGLSQLMSLRYGTLPIVRETGGLKDTVVPYNEYEGTGNGFSFRNYNAHEMLATVRNAERIYYDKKREWNKMVDRAMAADFSWGNSARQYEEMYNWLIGDK